MLLKSSVFFCPIFMYNRHIRGVAMEIIFYIVLVVMTPAIIGTIGGMYVHIRDSKQKLEYKKMHEERRLEEIKQENYLLENESMRQELDRIREERKRLESTAGGGRWLIEEKERLNEQIESKDEKSDVEKEG